LIQPAIDLAENGVTLSDAEARSLKEASADFLKYNRVSPVFVRAGGWKAGDRLVQKDLARTLRRIRDGGKDAFYGGLTARLIVAEMQRGKGLITAGDLLRYKARERQPAVFDYKAYRIVTMPLPGSGSVVLQQMMKMAEELPLHEYGFESLRSVHYMTEIERLAYADRAKYLGDPDFFHVPVKALTGDAYLKQRLSLIDPVKAGNSQAVQAGLVTEKSEETTHLDVYDAEGNAVAITTTLNGGYGSKVVVAGAGFLLNNEMDDFSSKPGTPNMFGAIGAEANSIFPGKRMLSSMTPTIVLDKGRPYLIVGTPGGTTITTSVFQTLMDILEFGLDPKDAVDQPKFHHPGLPDTLYVERDFPPALRGPLQAMGYTLTERSAIGRTELIEIANGLIKAVGDRRGEDAADGY
jgi:gamma-glutamyltranspeptidase/glutathione hydrolase